MKRITMLLSILLIGMTVSCKKDIGSSDPAESDFVKGGKTLEPTEQQKKLENTAIAVLDEVNPQDFLAIKDLVDYFVETYLSENTDLSAVEEVVSRRLEKAYSVDEKVTVDTPQEYYAEIFEKTILEFSIITGKIVADPVKWTYEPADNLTVSFKDEKGTDCLVAIDAKGELGSFLYSSWYDIIDVAKCRFILQFLTS